MLTEERRQQLKSDLLDLYANVAETSEQIDNYEAQLGVMDDDELLSEAVDAGLIDE